MKKRMGVNVGTSSILIIFVVVCLVSFAALSIVSANSDYNLTQKMAEREKNYYSACSLAHNDLDEIDEQLHVFESEAKEINEYRKLCLKIPGYDAETGLLTRVYPVSDIQSLVVVLRIKGMAESCSYEILEWKLVVTEELEYNEKLPVLQG